MPSCPSFLTESGTRERTRGKPSVDLDRLPLKPIVTTPLTPGCRSRPGRSSGLIARKVLPHGQLGGLKVWVWEAETLAVSKMMFFRRNDIADVEQVLTVQGTGFDRPWVREQLLAMYGIRDPRLAAWDDLDRAVSPS